MFIADFDFTVNHSPECAAVAIIFESDPPPSVNLNISREYGNISALIIEVKRGPQKIKCSETVVDLTKADANITMGLPPDTCEIVVALFKTNNDDQKGTVKVTSL